MGYNHIPLDEASQKLCATVLLWGVYQYKVLFMGIKNSPDIFQGIMNSLFNDVPFASMYLDDILIISDESIEDHLSKVHTVLERLDKAGFRANMRKCFFCQHSLEYLGYQITRQGMQPQPKKVEAMLQIQISTNVRQLSHFLGMVNYYWNMWQKCSHILVPLSSLVSQGKKWEWDPVQQQAFEENK